MSEPKLPQEFLARLRAVTNKRPRTVIDHIVEHGHITTAELETLYGYKHPPRAARDVREHGIPLETFRVQNAEGRWIAAYRFADPSQVRFDRQAGRKAFSKQFKESLLDSFGCQCSICREHYEARYLQVDHRVPYEVSGEASGSERKTADYMLLCGSCNRAKSWSCEHCRNWTDERSPGVCQACYWASPDVYQHVALHDTRRVDLVWTGEQVDAYERLKKRADALDEPMPDYVKRVLERHLKRRA